MFKKLDIGLKHRAIFFFIIIIIFVSGQNKPFAKDNSQLLNEKNKKAAAKLMRDDAEWKKILTKEQYAVMRQKGTEEAFSGKYNIFKKIGIFKCAGCGNELFSSEQKFDSGTGWPSFWAPISEDSIKTEADESYGMRRIEVLCSRCDSHLGHVFNDGPKPTGLRYCINSVTLNFIESDSGK